MPTPSFGVGEQEGRGIRDSISSNNKPLQISLSHSLLPHASASISPAPLSLIWHLNLSGGKATEQQFLQLRRRRRRRRRWRRQWQRQRKGKSKADSSKEEEEGLVRVSLESYGWLCFGTSLPNSFLRRRLLLTPLSSAPISSKRLNPWSVSLSISFVFAHQFQVPAFVSSRNLQIEFNVYYLPVVWEHL